MKLICPKCNTRLSFPDEKLKPEGTRFRCSKCETVLVCKKKVQKNSQEPVREPKLPSSPSSPAVPEVSPPPAVPVDSQELDKEQKRQKQFSPPVAEREKVATGKAVLVAAVAGLLLLVIVAVFFFSSQRRSPQVQHLSPSPVKELPRAQSPIRESAPQAGSPAGAPTEPPHGGESVSRPSS